MNIVPSPLQFVQVDAAVPLIDSRVYCREVIQVNHGDWLSDTLYKHLAAIEKEFGQVRFETDYVNIPNGGRKTTKYALLTEAQCNACLVLSRNSKKTIEAKLQLIADFERAKSILRSQLEYQFTRPATPSPAGYCHTFWKVWADSGIKDPWYVRRVIVANHEYRIVNKLVCVSHDVYTELVLTFRSQAGANPAELPMELQPLFREFEEKRKNTRAAQLK
jgi:hypothetical protein